MSGRRSRDKGYRGERETVLKFQEAGFAAERVPNSGSSRGRFGGDISIPMQGEDHRAEVKWRKDGFKTLRGWLCDVRLLVLKTDREEDLVALRLRDFLELAKRAEGQRDEQPSMDAAVRR